MRAGFIIIALVFSLGTLAQEDCAKIKNGTFKSVEEGRGDLIIIRKGKVQTEEHAATGLKLTMEVVWTSDCTYELRNVRVVKGEFSNPFPAGAVLHNEVIEVSDKSYRVRSWLSIAPDQKFEFTILII